MTVRQYYEKFGLPVYKGSGELLDIYSCGAEAYQLCVRQADKEGVELYLSEIEKAGFRLENSNCICQNQFWEYVQNGYSLRASFMPKISTLRLTCGKTFSSPPSQSLGGDGVTFPTLAQMQIRMGMCYCIQLRDGTFILIDGGYRDGADTDRLYEYLRQRATDGKKPFIRAWFISHSHPDHTRLASDFLERYHNDVELGGAVYNFPDFDSIEVLRDSVEINCAEAERFVKSVSEYFPSAYRYVCHTGDVMTFPGVRVTTVMTHEDVYPSAVVSFNHTSCAWRFDFDSGRSFICLGDIWTNMCEQMAQTFSPEYLKADVMQVTHHGLIGGHISLYQAVDPEICLWPSPEDRFNGKYTDSRRVAEGKPTVQYCIGEGGCDYNMWLRNDGIKTREHYHAGRTTIIPM